jgi:hypothetical protein
VWLFGCPVTQLTSDGLPDQYFDPVTADEIVRHAVLRKSGEYYKREKDSEAMVECRKAAGKRLLRIVEISVAADAKTPKEL